MNSILDEPIVTVPTRSLFVVKGAKIKAILGNYLYLAEFSNHLDWYIVWSFYPTYDRQGKLIARLHEDATLQLRIDNDSRYQLQKILPLSIWKYNHSFRMDFHSYLRIDPKEISSAKLKLAFKKWTDMAKNAKWVGRGGNYKLLDEEVIMKPDEPISGIEKVIPRSPAKPKPKPRSNISFKELIKSWRLCNNISTMIQDKDLAKITDYKNGYLNLYATTLKKATDALYPHLRINHPKITKRNIYEALVAFRRAYSENYNEIENLIRNTLNEPNQG